MADRVPALLAGDHFVLNRLLATDLAFGGAAWDLREIELAWPHVPFGPVAEVDEASGTEDEMIEALQGVRACITQMAPLTARILGECPDLEFFAVSRGGPVNVNLAAATAHGVTVTFAPGRNATATAEYTVGLMLAAMRRIARSDAEVRTGRWPSSLYAYTEAGLELAGSTVGLIGAGSVGRRVAHALLGMGAEVLVHDPYACPSGIPSGTRRVGLDVLLDASAVVSLHARLTDETRGLLDARRLAAMRPGSVLVNTARGALVDHGALADALHSGHLYAAGLDVVDLEPLPADHPLRTAPNVVLTPHLAGASRAVAERASRIVTSEATRWQRGEPLLHCANPAVGTAAP
ncbi:2-hydroxyacid dehydrogenase [Pseudonocardia sp. NPDC049635]|uniref:2-hydroxyacid dehydrogenase n=1 Tax=Pseudonocardia sp. NPDC049635 TaxID=3155506 RepID=UPI0033E4350C